MKEIELEELLWRAVESRLGIEVEASDIDALKRRLYTTRRKAQEQGNHNFDGLALLTPPQDPDTKLWIVKNAT